MLILLEAIRHGDVRRFGDHESHELVGVGTGGLLGHWEECSHNGIEGEWKIGDIGQGLILTQYDHAEAETEED